MTDLACRVIDVCRQIAGFSEERGRTTRTFLSSPMREVHRVLGDWMRSLGMQVRIDPAGNLRGVTGAAGPRLIIGSHLDTVPNAGAFDGVLGVALAIALVEALGNDAPGNAQTASIEVIGFSEEEGVRFGIPFIGSRALTGTLDDSTISRGIGAAIRAFGLDPADMDKARLDRNVAGFLEFHIEQGPVLDDLGLRLGIVEGILGQSRMHVTFHGQANHAGTTPMALRRDALAAAAEWISRVECLALPDPELRATVGAVEVEPNATNVITGKVRASLDVRHWSDDRRHRATVALLHAAREIGERRKIAIEVEKSLDQPATLMDRDLTARLGRAVAAAGYRVHPMMSGAGHDAMILAPHVPTAMLFLRSPGGLSHHPDESAVLEDVEAALEVGLRFVRDV
jgi:allantoate deiminase